MIEFAIALTAASLMLLVVALIGRYAEIKRQSEITVESNDQ